MSIIRDRRLPIREKRDGSISAYAGTLGALAAEGGENGLVPRVRTFAQDTRSDLQAALELLGTIEDLVVVVHGPAGCFSGLIGAQRALVTGIGERDSILGGDKKLWATLRKAVVELHPRAIAVVGSPVSAINNDDADAVVVEAREEFGLPVFLVRADAFRSKLSANGADLVSHAILREVSSQRKAGQPGSDVALISIKEKAGDVEALTEPLSALGVHVETFPRFSRPQDWHRAGQARATVAIDPSDADFVGRALEEELAIPYVSSVAPVGIRNTGAWLTKIADALGKTAEAAALREHYAGSLESWKQAFGRHQGARAYVSAPPGIAFALVDLVEELGLGIAGLTLSHAESRHQDGLAELAQKYPTLPVLVGEGQSFEEANLLRRIGANLYVGQSSPLGHALRLGIPVLDLAGIPYLGFTGAVRFAEAAYRRLDNAALAQFLSEGEEIYSEQWFSKSTHWFVKHEVK